MLAPGISAPHGVPSASSAVLFETQKTKTICDPPRQRFRIQTNKKNVGGQMCISLDESYVYEYVSIYVYIMYMLCK